jgi:hypothetical protein
VPAADTTSINQARLRRFGPPAVCISVYCFIAYLAYSPTPLFGGNRIFSCACGDPVQQAWYLAWTPYALLHGHNLFYTTQLNYPFGVDLGSNTLMPLLGLLAAPFTLTIGPAGALVLMMRLGFALSAVSMCLVLRRWTTWWPAAFIGGLMYGFSPYMLGQAHTHLHLLFVPLPPLFLALGDELLIRRRWSVRKTGLSIGLVAGLQYLIAAEVLATCALMAAIGVAFLALCHPREVRAGAVRLFGAAAWAAVPFLVLTAYPIYTDFTGPGHIAGPTQPTSILSSYHSDLIAPFVPTVDQRFAPSSWFALGDTFGAGNYPENGSYLGIPLVVALLGIAYWGRRVALVRFTSFMALAAFVLALGPRLEVDGHLTHVPLPYALLLHAPLFAGGVPDRFSLYIQMFSAVLVAVGVDRLRRRATSAWWVRAKHALNRRSGPGSVRLREAVVIAAVTIAFVPLIPRFPVLTVATNTPSYVSDGSLASDAADSSVLTYPYNQDLWDIPMLWQADARMPFSLLGAYAIITGRNGHVLPAPPVLLPAAMQTLFAAALGDAEPPGTGAANATVRPPPLTPALVTQLRTFLTNYRVDTILVQRVGYDPGLVLTDLTHALRVTPLRAGGLYVWSGVQRDLQRK